MGNTNLYKLLPKVDEVLENNAVKELLVNIPRSTILDAIRHEIESLRLNIKSNNCSKEEVIKQLDALITNISIRARREDSYKLRKVINGTGTVIHTNLGRAPLNQKVLEHINDVANNYSNLEYDIDTGERGSRYSIIESIICKITGGESALVVNNNAAAVLLTLSTLSKGREAIVSRGELIEIGGSFRIPDVMEESGASLVEVGTTNKTHLRDYENAINENTGAILKVHTSNYRILGFTSTVSAKELVEIKTKYNIPIIEDLGSGVLVDLSKYGLDYEPTVQDSILNGVDLVTFSGDKLLGGPQAGIIVGKESYISQMKRNPLTRAFRVDKFTMAALEATLKFYLDEELAIKEIPTLNMLTMAVEEMQNRALELYGMIEEKITDNILDFQISDSYSEVGGGSLPLAKLPSKCIVFSSDRCSIDVIERLLRSFDTPIITRIYKDKIYLDLRTIKREEFSDIIKGLSHVKDAILSNDLL